MEDRQKTYSDRLAVLDARLSDNACDCIATYGPDFAASYWFGGFEDPPVRACNACFIQYAAALAGEYYETVSQCDECRRPGVRTVPLLCRSMADPRHTWVFRVCVECLS